MFLRFPNAVKLDFTLQNGSVDQTISVTSAAPAIDTQSSAVATVIGNQTVTQLPLNGRNVYTLEGTVPGAAPDNTGRIRFNGIRSRSNEVLVDGVSQIPPETRSDPVSPPPIDSIDEFRVASSGYSAEFGSAAGGLINVATKAGTNKVHGTLWEFLRNDALNTANYFTPAGQSKPILRQNQFGAAMGGPIYIPHLYDGRNKTFFFVDYEGLRVRTQSVFNVTVPTLAMRGGDLSAFLGAPLGTDSAGNVIYQGQTYDPTTTRKVNGVTVRDPFPGNIIPTPKFSSVAIGLMKYYPVPTNDALSQNLQNKTSTGSNTNRYDIRADENISPRNRVFGRWSDYRSTPLPSVPFRGAAGDFISDIGEQRSLSTSFITTLSPSFFNEARGLFLQSKTNNIPYLSDQPVSQNLGIGGITTQAGLPDVDISNIQQIGSSASGTFLQDNQRMFAVMDNVTILRGGQSIKTGVEVRFYRMKIFQPSFYNGYFGFRSAETSSPGSLSSKTGNAFASFLLGQADSTQYTQVDPGQEVNGEYYAGFFQDDWRATRRLTLNLGLRYEINSRLADKRGLSSTFDTKTQTVLAGAARPIPPLSLTNVAPRFGLAYDARGDQSMLVRAGFGLFYSPITGNGGNPLNGVPKFPYAFTSNAPSPDGITPVSTLSVGPVIQPSYPINSPQLGYGTAVQIQSPNTAPYVYQWNVGIEQQFGKSLVGDISYVATAAHKFDIGRLNYENVDQVPYSLAKQAAIAQGTTNPNTSGLLPYPNFASVQAINPRWGNSIYNSLQLKLEQRVRWGLSYLLSYTWAKYIDNGSESYNSLGGDWITDIYNPRLDRAESTAEIPQRFVASYVWDIPFGRGLQHNMSRTLDAIAGGWQISGIATLQDGQPVDVQQSTITSNTFSLIQRPNSTGSPILHSGRSVTKFFNTSAFSAAAPQSVGTSPRNPVRSPGLTDFDLALMKNWHLYEADIIQFRMEAFNLSNTPPLILQTRTTFNPSLTLAQQSFGQITSAGNGRVLQAALKFYF
jgi:TonB-dependent Receptor Plug Domain